MSFAAPFWLALSALALVVIAYHIRRRRTVTIPSIQLWRLLEGTVPKSRITIKPPKTSIFLLLQLLAVLLTAVALSQPHVGDAPPAHRIFVLDASGSMRATDVSPSRFAAAVAAVRATIADEPATAAARVSLVVAGTPSHVAAARLADSTSLDAALAALMPTDGEVDWNVVASAVASLAAAGESTEIIVLSDAVDAAAAAISRAAPSAVLAEQAFGSAGAANAALTATLVPIDAAARQWEAHGSIAFAGGMDTATITVAFRGDNDTAFRDWDRLTVRLTPGNTVEPFTIGLILPGPGAVTLRLGDDAGPHDNAAYFVVRTAPRVADVLYVGAGNDILTRALLSVPGVRLSSAQGLPADSARYDLVIIDNLAVQAHPGTNTVFLGTGRIVGAPFPAVFTGPSPNAWLTDHPLSQSVSWSRLVPERYYQVPLLPGADVVVEMPGMPLVQARTTSFGREVVVAFEIRGSAWTEEPGFPVFVANLVRWAVPSLGAVAPTPCVVGTPCTINPRFLAGVITLPDGSSRAMAPGVTAGAALPAGLAGGLTFDRAGVYRIVADGKPMLVAVNAPVATDGTLGVATEAAADLGGRQAIWWWLLAAILLVLVVEGWLAGRGPERFLQGRALARGNPLAGRRRVMLALRLATIAFLVAAIAGMPILWPQTSGNHVLVVDPAAGVDTEGLRAAATASGAKVGVVTADGQPRITSELDIGAPAAPGSSAGGGAATDLGAALTLAAAMIPPGESGHIVLATDGTETRGDLFSILPELIDRGIIVDVLPTPSLQPGDVIVERVSAPVGLHEGDAFRLTATIFAETATPVTISIYKDGVIIGEPTPASLVTGRNRILVPIQAGNAGRGLYEVVVSAPGDPFPGNDRNGVVVEIDTQPRLAIIARQATDASQLAGALALHGFRSTILAPSAAPKTLAEWLAYDAVILVDMPATDLTTAQLEQLETYVEINGRGLLILGGPNSYGPGGYFDTPIEDMSPLGSRDERQRPDVSIVFMIDRSSSMNSITLSGTSRLEVAKRAIIDTLGVVAPNTSIGVIFFDTTGIIYFGEPFVNAAGDTRTRPAPAPTPAEMRAALSVVGPGGGTNPYSSMVLALQMLQASEAPVRHIILLSDGAITPENYEPIIGAAITQNTTISGVQIATANASLLQQVAERTGGKYTFTQGWDTLTQIFAQEVTLFGSPVKNETIAPRWFDRDADFLRGLPNTMPSLGGYVLTYLKDEADLHLATTNSRGQSVPLLASWRYGAGQVIALASQGVGNWAQAWMAWSEYPRLWAQAARQLLPEALGPGLHIAVDRVGDTVTVVVDALDPDGIPVTGLALQARAALAAAGVEVGADIPVTLTEIAPGRYAGSFLTDGPGTYTVSASIGGLTADVAIHLGFPDRYQFAQASTTAIEALAAATGGRVLTSVGDLSSERNWVQAAGWWLWLLIALVLLMLELTLRYAPGLFFWRRRKADAPGAAKAAPAAPPLADVA